MNFSEKTYKYVQGIGAWATAFGIILILSPLLDYNFYDRSYYGVIFLVRRIITVGLSATFLFLLANRCFRLHHGRNNEQYWVGTLLMIRNYIIVCIIVVLGWFISSFFVGF
jgi:hypothetical protein